MAGSEGEHEYKHCAGFRAPTTPNLEEDMVKMMFLFLLGVAILTLSVSAPAQEQAGNGGVKTPVDELPTGGSELEKSPPPDENNPQHRNVAHAKSGGFKNHISREGSCGFSKEGKIEYLVNTDKNNSYKVTIRKNWRSGAKSGVSDYTVVSAAGGKSSQGCTASGNIPVTTYSRRVVGESKNK